jgi:hypothetical protein
MGFKKITKRLLFFGPPILGAFGCTDTFTDQGIAQLQLLLGHLRHNDDIAKIKYILLEQLQLTMVVWETVSVVNCTSDEVYRTMLAHMCLDIC